MIKVPTEELEKLLRISDEILTAFIRHRKETHHIQPSKCVTCQNSDEVIERCRAYIKEFENASFGTEPPRP